MGELRSIRTYISRLCVLRRLRNLGFSSVFTPFIFVFSLLKPEHSKTMGFAAIWNSHPKKYGPGSRTCRVCGNSHGLIRKYGLNCCRQCFRSNAKEIGFIKYR
ncbi:40S ribosomal protein S29 [Brassica napus]|nr:40S ribosomal protein S29 [Brassica napus]